VTTAAVVLVGWLAVAVSCVQFVPQVVRTVRTGDLDGVSPLMWAVLTAQGVAWATFGWRAGLVPSVLTNLVLLASAVVMLQRLVAGGAAGAQRALVAAALLLAVDVAVILALPNAVLGGLAAAIAMVSQVPQVVTALRTDDLSGLSRPMFLLGALAGACWFLFGLGTAQPAIWVSASFVTALTVVILARIVVTSRRSALAGTDSGTVPVTV
jgi:uncharacterized protein with PQ loop repeat